MCEVTHSPLAGSDSQGLYTPRSQHGQEGGEPVGQWAGGFRKGKAHPLLERNHRRPAGDYKDKCASCRGLSEPLEEGLVWERMEAGKTAHRGQTSLGEKMVASSRGGMGDREG